jgi:hypothetical protein
MVAQEMDNAVEQALQRFSGVKRAGSGMTVLGASAFDAGHSASRRLVHSYHAHLPDKIDRLPVSRERISV